MIQSSRSNFKGVLLVFIAVLVSIFMSVAYLQRASALEPWEVDGWSQIDAGNSYTCALSVGKVYCWGYNTDGQLGNNSTSNSAVPVAVDTSGVLAGKTVTAFSTGVSHSCVVASDNKAYCWGSNDVGQLGNNTTTNSSVPVAVDVSGDLAGKTILSISTGNQRTCVIASDNQAYCWGVLVLTPAAIDTSGVLAGKTIASISVGGSHSCVVASDNQAYCWGYNTDGQLGNNSTSNSAVPVAVDTSGVLAGKTIASISAGGSHSCVIASDNQAYCWGSSSLGQVGNNSTASSLVPVAVDTSGVLAGKTVLSIKTGSQRHTCAIASDNQVYCWGSNNIGQLGDSSTIGRLVPVAVDTSGVLAGKTVLSVSSGNLHTCGIASDNQAYCWGFNSSGQLGNNSVVDSSSPVKVIAFASPVVTSASFSSQNNRSILSVTGTNFPPYSLALTQSIVSVNGQALPFCTDGLGLTAQQFVDAGYSSAIVSDTPPCYLLIDGSGIIFTATSAKIWLADSFDITAEGTVSVNGSNIYTFNHVTPPVVIPAPPVVSVPPALVVAVTRVLDDIPEDIEDLIVSIFGDDKPISTIVQEFISNRPTFSGHANPFSTVVVTVHSDPVTCTTTADVTGYWSCTLLTGLPLGDHQVFVKVTTTDNQIVEAGPYKVTVRADTPATVDSNTKAEEVKTENTTFPWIWVSVGAGVLMLAVIIIAISRRRKAV